MGTRHFGFRMVQVAAALVLAFAVLFVAVPGARALDAAAPAKPATLMPARTAPVDVLSLWASPLPSLVNSPAAARGSATRPYITSLSRTSAKPGIRLTIRGRGFGAKRGKGEVLFGVFKSVKYVRWSKTRIVCTVPAIPAGRGTLKVRTATRTSNGKRFTVESLTTVVPKTTDVLTDATVADASTTDGSTYTFTDTSETSALAPGDVIVGEPTAALPDGIFGKVTAVTEGGGSVATEPATLEDVFTRAQFSADHPITQDDVASATLPGGMSLVRSRAQRPELITLRFKEVGVSDDLATDLGPVVLSGTITLKITMHVGGAIDWGGVKSFEMSEITTVSSDLRASSSLSASVGAEKEWEIAKIPGFTVMAGPVPLYFQPKLAIVVGVEGEVSKGLTTSVHEEIAGGIGLAYQSGKFTPWTHFKTKSSYQPPTVTTTCSLKAYAGAKLGLKLYGLAGPYIKLDGFAKLSANVSKTPWWKLSAGIEAAMGVEIGGNYGFIKWGLDWQSGNLTIAEWPLAQATTTPTPPPGGPSIGDAYGGGVVAYILQPRDSGYVAGETHGLIAATADQTSDSGIPWLSSTALSMPGALGTAIGTGAANTDAIIAQYGAGSTHAAGLARAYTGGGYSDWFLPSKDELNQLYLNRVAIGGFHTASDDWALYWSSSRWAAGSEYGPLFQDFVDGGQWDGGGVIYALRVRAVRAF